MEVVVSVKVLRVYYSLQYSTGSVVHLSLMEPTLDDQVKPGVVFSSDDEEEKKAVELLKVELVLNVPPMEDGGKIQQYLYLVIK